MFLFKNAHCNISVQIERYKYTCSIQYRRLNGKNRFGTFKWNSKLPHLQLPFVVAVFLQSKVNEKLVCRGMKKLNYMIICRTFNFEFSSYNLLSYRRRQIDLLWKGQRHKMSSVDVTKCKHSTTHFWRRKKIKSQPLVYAVLLYFIEELNGGHTEVDIGSLLRNQTVFEYKCLRSMYSCRRWEL